LLEQFPGTDVLVDPMIKITVPNPVFLKESLPFIRFYKRRTIRPP